MVKLRVDGDNAPAQARMFEAVLDQRALVDQAKAKANAVRRSVPRRNDRQDASLLAKSAARAVRQQSESISLDLLIDAAAAGTFKIPAGQAVDAALA